MDAIHSHLDGDLRIINCSPVQEVTNVDDKVPWSRLNINPGLLMTDLQAGLAVCGQDGQHAPVSMRACSIMHDHQPM